MSEEIGLAIEHYIEEQLRKALERRNPNHPALKKIYCSTYEAQRAYLEGIREEMLKEMENKKEGGIKRNEKEA